MYNLDYTWKLASYSGGSMGSHVVNEWSNELQTGNDCNSIRRNNNFCFNRSNSNNLTEANLKVVLGGTKRIKLLWCSVSLLKLVYKKFCVLDILKLRRMFGMAISTIKSKSCQYPGYNGVVILSQNLINTIKSVNSVNLFASINYFNSINSKSVDNSTGSYSWVPCLIQNRDEKATCETHNPKVKNTVLQLLNHNQMSRPNTFVS